MLCHSALPSGSQPPSGRSLGTPRKPSGAATTWSYNGVGQRLSQTTPEGDTTTFGYDPLGRLTQVRDPLGRSTRFSHNEQGQLLSQTDALGFSVSVPNERELGEK